MSDAPEIKVKLTAEDAGVSAAIKELGSQLKNLKKTQDDTAASGFKLASAFEAIASAGALLGIAKIGRDAFDSAANIGKLSDKTGISTQTLSVYNKVAGDVGASTEQLDKSLIKAAKSITDFQQGGTKAAGGFALLNISAKDFAGLNSDQKLQLVVGKLGAMQASFQKTAAAQQIFGKGASDVGLIANSIVAQGMDKATAATAKLGLLLDQSTTDSFRESKASMQELSDVGKGMATQFEAGLLPAVSDVGDTLIDSLTQGGVSFKDLGRYAGDAVRGIVLVFLGLGQTIGTVIEGVGELWSAEFDLIRSEGTTAFVAIGQAVRGNFSGAFATLKAGARDGTIAVEEEVEKQKAIYGTLGDSFRADYANLFPSDAEEERRRKERLARLRPDKQVEAPQPKPKEVNDAAERAELALLSKQLEDEIAIRQAYAKQAEQIDRDQYDRGEITLKEYYDRRRAETQAATSDELAILKQGLAAAQNEVTKATTAKAAAATPKESDKQEAARLNALAKVDELQTKISTAQIESATKIKALDDAEFKAKQDSQQQTLDFEKQLAELQGKRGETARTEIEAEAQKRSQQIAQAGGDSATQARLKAELEQWKQLKLAVADYDEARQKTEEDTKAFEIAKQAIDLNQKSGKISPLESEREINQLIKDRLPLLKADADAELGAAKKTGNQDNIAQSQQQRAQIENLTISAEKLGNTLGQSVAGDFSTFFETVGRGTQSVAKSFQKLAASVIGSIEQMLVKLLLLKIAQSATNTGFGQSSFGSAFLSGFSGKAEGGLIKGPGGPKSDSIPARLSAGEYVVKADAVSRFGAHNLEAINRGLQPPSFADLALPKFAEGGPVGLVGAPGASGNVRVGIELEEGLILRHMSSKAAGRIVLEHITNNPKAASKALGRSQG
jgi:hypothetical protein